jgi:hypothetical protein
MAYSREEVVNPDPPWAPGTPVPPDLDIDPIQFLHSDARPDPGAILLEPPD